MKRFVSILLIITMIFSMSATVFAKSLTGNSSSHDIYKLTFDNSENTRYFNSTKAGGNDNYEKAVNYIKNLDLEKRGLIGLEEQFTDNIKQQLESGDKIKSIQFHIPKTIKQSNFPRNTREKYDATVDYGSYDGFKMKAAYTIVEKAWDEIKLTDEEKIESWANGVVNVVAGFTKWEIWVPFTLLQAGADNVSSFKDSKLYIWHHGWQYDRYILIQDKNKKASSNSNAYVPILHDQKYVVELDSLLATAGFGKYELDKTLGPYDFSTKNFSNKSKTQRTAYEQYITSDILQIYEDLMPSHPRAVFKRN